MSISDPAQLMQRVPELQALIDDPKIRRAIESGDTFKVYRVLVLARLFRRLPEHRELLRLLTSERRLFVKPLKGTPALGSINSVGFGFIGHAEKNSDDSYVALHAFVIFFVIPLVPLGAYVVKSTGNRQWQIYARAPLGILGWLYTRGLAMSAVLLVLVGAAHSYQQSNTQDLLLVNGFDVPLTVNFAHQTALVPAHGHATMAIKIGPAHGTASANQGEGGVIDTLDQTMVSSERLSVWNIAGAAPLMVNTVTYYKNRPSDPAAGDSQSILCGQHFIEMEPVKYLFTELPDTLSMGKYDNQTTVNQLTLAKRDGIPLGAKACVNYAFTHGIERQLAKASELLGELNQWEPETMSAALYAAQKVSNAEAVRVAQRIIKAKPGDVGVERMVQSIREDAGEYDALLREYASRAQLHPDSANEQYLYAALLSGVEGVEKMQALAQQFPEDPNILRSLVWRTAAHGDFATASQDMRRLAKLSAADVTRLFDLDIRLLVSQRKGFDAMNKLNAVIRDEVAENRGGRAAEYGLVARYMGADAEFYLKSLPGDEKNTLMLDFYRVRAGLQPILPNSALSGNVKLALALRNAPDQALQVARELPQEQFTAFGIEQLSLLYAEAVRVDDKVLADKLQAYLHLTKTEVATLRPFIRGEAISLDAIDLDVDVQAAAYLVRSRNAQLPAAERAAWRSRAAKYDLLHSVISTAIAHWPN